MEKCGDDVLLEVTKFSNWRTANTLTRTCRRFYGLSNNPQTACRFWPELLLLNKDRPLGDVFNHVLIDELHKRKIPKHVQISDCKTWIASPNSLLRYLATKLELESLELHLEDMKGDGLDVKWIKELIFGGLFMARGALQKMKLKEIIWLGWGTSQLPSALAENPNIVKVWSDVTFWPDTSLLAVQSKTESLITTKDTANEMLNRQHKQNIAVGVWLNLCDLDIVYDSSVFDNPINIDTLPVFLPKLKSFSCSQKIIAPLAQTWGVQMSHQLTKLSLSTAVHHNVWHQRMTYQECDRHLICTSSIHGQNYSLRDKDLHLALIQLQCLEELSLHNHWRLQCQFLPLVVLNNQNTLRTLSLKGCLINDLTLHQSMRHTTKFKKLKVLQVDSCLRLEFALPELLQNARTGWGPQLTDLSLSHNPFISSLSFLELFAAPTPFHSLIDLALTPFFRDIDDDEKLLPSKLPHIRQVKFCHCLCFNELRHVQKWTEPLGASNVKIPTKKNQDNLDYWPCERRDWASWRVLLKSALIAAEIDSL